MLRENLLIDVFLLLESKSMSVHFGHELLPLSCQIRILIKEFGTSCNHTKSLYKIGKSILLKCKSMPIHLDMNYCHTLVKFISQSK